MRFFWAGDTRAKTSVCSATAASASSDIRSSSAPSTIRSVGDAHLLADRPGDQLAVAGQDLHAHAAGPQLRQCLARRRVGRIEEGDEPAQDQIALVVGR